MQLLLQTSNYFCKAVYLRYLCLIRKELLWLNNYPYLNVSLLSKCFIKTIHLHLLAETWTGLLPLLPVKYYIIVVSQAEFLLWAKTTVLTAPVASVIPSALKWVFMGALPQGVSVVQKESYVPVFCQVLFPEKSVRIPCFCQGNFPAFGGAQLRIPAHEGMFHPVAFSLKDQ